MVDMPLNKEQFTLGNQFTWTKTKFVNKQKKKKKVKGSFSDTSFIFGKFVNKKIHLKIVQFSVAMSRFENRKTL